MGGQTPTIPDAYFFGDIKKGETQILRNRMLKPSDKLCDSLKGGEDTCLKMFLKTYNENKKSLFIGSRSVEAGKIGNFKWLSYEQVYIDAMKFSKGLSELGLCPYVDLKEKTKFFGIFSNNRIEWVIADIACWMDSVTIIPFIFGMDSVGISHIFAQSQLSTLLISSANYKKILDCYKEKRIPSLKNLISLDPLEETLIKESENEGLKLYYFKDILEIGNKSQKELTPSTPETIFTISYTSGTTSTPKGVVLTHKAASVLAAAISSGTYLNISRIKTLISILPLAHLMERLIFILLMYFNIKVGFFCGDLDKIGDDFQEIKPDILIGVPRLFQRFNAKIQSEFAKLGKFKSWLVKKGIDTKLANLRRKNVCSHYFYDRIVFSKIRNFFGGQLKYIFSSSAPMDKNLLEYFKIYLSCSFLQGYGQTELFGPCTITYDNDPDPTSVGGPLSSFDMKLVDIPEMDYYSTDLIEGKPYPRGEICCKGPQMCLGYYKDEERTKELFDTEGWLHTGDVGMILEGGRIRIIDRKKNIFKLSQGEYIAPEKIENVLSFSPFISQIFVEGNSLQNYLVAIVFPQKEKLMEYALTQNINETFEELVKNKNINKLILDEIKKLSKEKKLNSLETVAKIHIISKPLSIEDNLLTPTLKIKRPNARKYFKKEIDTMYEN